MEVKDTINREKYQRKACFYLFYPSGSLFEHSSEIRLSEDNAKKKTIFLSLLSEMNEQRVKSQMTEQREERRKLAFRLSRVATEFAEGKFV